MERVRLRMSVSSECRLILVKSAFEKLSVVLTHCVGLVMCSVDVLILLCVSICPQKTALSPKVSRDSRRRLLRPRIQPQVSRPAAGIPPGANPASSSAELQLVHPPYTRSSLSLISPSPPAICVYHRSRIRCGPDRGLVRILKCIVLIPLS